MSDFPTSLGDFQLAAKLHWAMVAPGRALLAGLVEVDETTIPPCVARTNRPPAGTGAVPRARCRWPPASRCTTVDGAECGSAPARLRRSQCRSRRHRQDRRLVRLFQRVQPLAVGALRPASGPADGPALPHRGVRRSRRRAGGDPRRPDEDRRHRRGGRGWRRLQPHAARLRRPLPLSSQGLPALPGEDQGQGGAAVLGCIRVC